MYFGEETGQFDFRLLKQALRDGTAGRQYPIGCALWDNINICGKLFSPLTIADYREVQLASGERKKAAILLRETPILEEFIAFDGHTHNSKGERIYGSRYDRSMIRQWLNYTGSDKDWWHPCQKGDIAETHYYGGGHPHSYLYYCSESLREAISPIVVDTVVFDEKGHRSGVCSTVDQAFLPSCEELCIDIGNGIDLRRVAWRQFSYYGFRTFVQGGRRYYADDRVVIKYNSDLKHLLPYQAYHKGYTHKTVVKCWTRSSMPRFSKEGQYCNTAVCAIDSEGCIYNENNTTNLWAPLPAHAIVG